MCDASTVVDVVMESARIAHRRARLFASDPIRTTEIHYRRVQRFRRHFFEVAIDGLESLVGSTDRQIESMRCRAIQILIEVIGKDQLQVDALALAPPWTARAHVAQRKVGLVVVTKRLTHVGPVVHDHDRAQQRNIPTIQIQVAAQLRRGV